MRSPDFAYTSALSVYHVTHCRRSLYILLPPHNNFLPFLVRMSTSMSHALNRSPVIECHSFAESRFPWTMRICGFIVLYCCLFAAFVRVSAELSLMKTLRGRFEPKDVPGGWFNLAAFKVPAFSLVCVYLSSSNERLREIRREIHALMGSTLPPVSS